MLQAYALVIPLDQCSATTLDASAASSDAERELVMLPSDAGRQGRQGLSVASLS